MATISEVPARPATSEAGWTGFSVLPAPPRRLSDRTHELARRSLSGEYARAMAVAGFALDEKAVAGLSPDMRYAMAARLVAEQAPIRIVPGELIVGSATLLEAPRHGTPVANVPSTSHTTVGFDRVLHSGYRDLRGKIAARPRRGGLDEQGADLLNFQIVWSLLTFGIMTVALFSFITKASIGSPGDDSYLHPVFTMVAILYLLNFIYPVIVSILICRNGLRKYYYPLIRFIRS